MFTKKESLYINAIKSESQLKLDYKRLSNDQVVSMANSSFPVDNHMLPVGIAQKLNNSQVKIENTFISTLLISDTTKLVPKGLADKLTDCEIAKFNNELDIVVLKTTLFETQDYFSKTGIDYIYSLFHVMNLHVEKTVCKNELLMFIYNEKVFILVLDKGGMISHNEVIDLPTFDSIKKTHFYEDDEDGKKLFDEIFYLEFSEIIQNILANYYKKKSGNFVEKVTILYCVQQFTNDDIEKLSSELMMKVEQHPINLDEEIFELSRDKHIEKSFVRPRKKKKKRDYTWLYTLIFGIILVIAIYKFFEFMSSSEEDSSFEAVKTEKIAVVPTPTNIVLKLPDHVTANDKIVQRIKAVFATIPDDIILKEFRINANAIELKATLHQANSFSKEFKTALDILYKSTQSKILDSNKTDNVDALITSKGMIELQNITYKSFDKEYIIDEFMPVERITEQLRILLPENTSIKYLSTTENGKISTFKYAIGIVVKTPKDFFNLISDLSSEIYSINVAYPVSMVKTQNGLEVEFELDFNQSK